MSYLRSLCSALFSVMLAATLCTGVSQCIGAPPGLNLGPVALESVGPMAFAPDGVLLVGDPKTATVYAIDTEDSKVGERGSGNQGFRTIADIEAAIAKTLGADGQVVLGELAVNPETGNVFVTANAGGSVHVVKVDSSGNASRINLDKVHHAAKSMPNPPADKETVRRGRKRNPRMQSITDLAYFDGKVMVTGVSADDSPSRVLEMPFPFADNSVTTSVEIFHAAHGRVEDAAIQTFLPMVIDGKPNLLAGFTCTPLVRFPVDKLDGSEKIRGTTVAELGNRNRPLDMIVYEKDGRSSILMTNTARGTMKISTDGIAQRETLTEKVSGGGTAGQPFETIESLGNVVQMDKLDDRHAIALVKRGNALSLEAIELP